MTAIDRLSGEHERTAVKWAESQFGDFLFPAINPKAGETKARNYRYTFVQRTVTYRELMRAFAAATGGADATKDKAPS